MTRVSLVLAFVVVAGMTGCAAHYSADVVNDPYGFFSGIWHGLISPLTLMVNIFSWFIGLFGISFLDSIQIIGRPNTGFFYYTGFAIGLCSYGANS